MAVQVAKYVLWPFNCLKTTSAHTGNPWELRAAAARSQAEAWERANRSNILGLRLARRQVSFTRLHS
jgi:hypothetical protein